LVVGYFISINGFIREIVYFRISRYFKRLNKNKVSKGPVEEGTNNGALADDVSL
jgi:hypothetical protein